jgi:hypothetical protein
LFIGGTDQNASKDFFCGAHGWDINLNSVSMPSITSSTGTYTNGTVGAFNIPDNVFKLEIDCTIPAKASNPSKIGDFFIQH